MSDQQSEFTSRPEIEIQSESEKRKVFNIQNGRIQYCNIQHTLVNTRNDSFLAVHNYLCYQEGDKLIKITQIVLQDKVLQIKDELRIISDSYLQDKEQKEQKKPQGVFGRRNNYSGGSKEEKSDTKNLIKNIINLFGNWLRIKKTSETSCAGEKLRKILKRMKYFNKMLIQELCKDKDICNCFIQFSQTDSETSIENSRIKDKPCHYKAIKNYTKLFQESRSRLEKQSTKSSQSNVQT